MKPNRGIIILSVIIGIIVILALYAGSVYNGLVKGSESVDASWAQVESQYQRRIDLIPNLVETVKGILTQEQEVFGAISEARTRYTGAATPNERANAASELESALSRLLVIMENYPVLRSVEAVQSLMAELAGTENRVAVERMRYNETVRDYNVTVKTFPRSLFANMFGFEPRVLFEAEAGAEEAPVVDF